MDDHFFVHPQIEQSVAFAKCSASEEALIMLAFWLAVGTIYMMLPIESWDEILWITVLLVQSIPYFSALCLSIISALPKLKSELIS